MSEFVVPTDFLIGGWFGVKKLCLPPKFSVFGQKIKIVAFQKGGAGMRVSHYNIEQKVDKEIGFGLGLGVRVRVRVRVGVGVGVRVKEICSVHLCIAGECRLDGIKIISLIIFDRPSYMDPILISRLYLGSYLFDNFVCLCLGHAV